jgi:hypothetical protein
VANLWPRCGHESEEPMSTPNTRLRSARRSSQGGCAHCPLAGANRAVPIDPGGQQGAHSRVVGGGASGDGVVSQAPAVHAIACCALRLAVNEILFLLYRTDRPCITRDAAAGDPLAGWTAVPRSAASSSEPPTSAGLACRPVRAWRRHLVKQIHYMGMAPLTRPVCDNDPVRQDIALWSVSVSFVRPRA